MLAQAWEVKSLDSDQGSPGLAFLSVHAVLKDTMRSGAGDLGREANKGMKR
jgi:hypothetical protein